MYNSFLPSVLIIADHRLGRSPSQRYRFEQYLDFFREEGFDWELSEIITEKDDRIFYAPGNHLKKAAILFKSLFIRWKDLRRAKNFDLIFIQREALLLGSSWFERQFHKRHQVVFDFDDSIWLLDTSPENKKFEFLKDPDKTKKNIGYAQAVIAGNDFLATYARRFNDQVFVIPTTIDTTLHCPPVAEQPTFQKRKTVIGWSGSVSTIKHFEQVVPVLKRICEAYPEQIEIHVIGQGIYAHPELNVVSKTWSAETEVACLQTFDIGIMPLPDDEWVKGKCGLKGLSYMACGVATVMSPVGVNTEIIQHGVNGMLAGSADEWFDMLSRLIDDPALRAKLGKKGRQTVVEKYSVEANKHRYLQILKSLIKS